MNSLIPNKKQLKDEISQLERQQVDLQTKIDALHYLLTAYYPKPQKTKITRRHDALFLERIKAIYEINRNRPMQVKDILEILSKDMPEQNVNHLKNKVMGLIRNQQLEKQEYGKYIFPNLEVVGDDNEESPTFI